MTLSRIVYCVAGAGLLFAATGCKVGTDYQKTQPQMPADWTAPQQSAAADNASLEQWWQTFDDATLNGLIQQADANSLDLHKALARIDQSRAMRAYSGGENLPAIDANGGYSRTRASKNSFSNIPGENSLYSAGFDAVWEVDLFGRIRRSIEASQAELERAIEDYSAVRVSLCAEVARNYIELRTAQARIRRAQENIDIQRKTLELTQNRFEAEIVPALDVAQAKLNLANTESEIPSLKIAETEAINRLAVILGTTPHTLRDRLIAPAPLPTVKTLPDAGIPAELLRRRPDIRSAERVLAAQTARTALAEADRYPVLSLAGTLGLESTHISNLGNWDSRTFGFGPSVRWSIFNGGRLKSLVAAQEALTRQTALSYQASVLKAVEEVENAMVSLAQEQIRAEALKRSVEAAMQSVSMVETLYKSGLTNFQNVLDTQRSLSQQQDRLAVSEGLILQHTIALYKAIGGGWDSEQQQQEIQ